MERQHSTNFYRIKEYYDNGNWSKERVYKVVGKPQGIFDWEYAEIVGENYE